MKNTFRMHPLQYCSFAWALSCFLASRTFNDYNKSAYQILKFKLTVYKLIEHGRQNDFLRLSANWQLLVGNGHN